MAFSDLCDAKRLLTKHGCRQELLGRTKAEARRGSSCQATSVEAEENRNGTERRLRLRLLASARELLVGSWIAQNAQLIALSA